MEVIRDLNKSSFGSVKRSNSLSRKNGSRESRNSLEKFTVKGNRETGQHLKEDVASREFFPFSGGRLQSLCLMGWFRREGATVAALERLHGKEGPSKQERARAGAEGSPWRLIVLIGEKADEVGTSDSHGGNVWKFISDYFYFLSERRSKERKTGKKLLDAWEEQKNF